MIRMKRVHGRITPNDADEILFSFGGKRSKVVRTFATKE